MSESEAIRLEEYDFLECETNYGVDLPEAMRIETTEEALKILEINKEEFTSPSSYFWRILLEKNPDLKNEIKMSNENELKLSRDYTYIIRTIHGVRVFTLCKGMIMQFFKSACDEVPVEIMRSSKGLISKVIKSSPWTTAVVSGAIEAGINSVKWYQGKITAKEFFLVTAKSLSINIVLIPVSALGGFCGVGAASLFGISSSGLVIAGLAGAILLSVAANWGLEKLCCKIGIFETDQNAIVNLTPEEWYKYCLKLYGVKEDVDLEILNVKRKDLLMTYHPGRIEDEQIRKSHEEKFKLYSMAYEVIVAVRKLKNITNN